MVSIKRELIAIYAIWLREIKGFLRARDKFFGVLVVPIAWFIVLGTGLASSIQFVGLEMDYGIFLVPGVAALPLLLTSIIFGVSVIQDRQFGFLKEIMVAPISRMSVVVGKCFGAATIATMQGILLLLLSILLGFKVSVSFLGLVPLMFIIALGFSSLGIMLAAFLKTVEGYNLISNFISWPLFIMSGAFFPLDVLPTWVRSLTYIDPMTYGVESLKHIITGTSSIPFTASIAAVLFFSFVAISVNTYIFVKRSG